MTGQTSAQPVAPPAATGRGGRGFRPPRKLNEVPSALFLALIPALLVAAWLVLRAAGSDLGSQNKLFEIALKIVTISATVIGGIWSYYAFFRQRLREPRLNVALAIRPLDLPEGKRLLKVYATVTNIGQIRVELAAWRLRAEQILPLTKTPLTDLTKGAFTDAQGHAHWNCLAEGTFGPADRSFVMALEPGEADSAAANLVIESGVDVVQVYSHFTCSSDGQPRWGWPSRTLVDLRKEMADRGDANEPAGTR